MTESELCTLAKKAVHTHTHTHTNTHSVRNIPFSMTESELKALAKKAVKERASKETPEIKQVSL